jgi:hypothetical protein
MTKILAQINLVWTEVESQALCVHAILSEGKLTSEQMHCHLREWNGQENEIYPGLLVDRDGERCTYCAEWGYDQKWADLFVFPNQPIAVGQIVTRTQILVTTAESYAYRVTEVIQMLA